jgi:SAM-dependent methyltransferase
MQTKCRISGSELEEVINLGSLYISGFSPSILADTPRAPLRIGISKTSGLLQLMDSVDRPALYEHYWYRSGTNETMRNQLADILRTATQWARLDDGDVVLDIGCNDGTLLALYGEMRSLFRIGIDPAQNLAEEAIPHCERHAADFFSRELYDELSGGKRAKIITTIAMFYGLEDPLKFVADLRECLDDDGIWILQLSYTPLMLKQNAFDNICHEHVEYYTLRSLSYLLRQFDLRIVDVEFNDTNSGSFRLVITHNSNPLREAPLFVRDIGSFRVESTIEYEERHSFDDPSVYIDYMKRLESLRRQTCDLLGDIKSSGRLVCGYGASTKGNTLLQFYGITPETLPCIAERQSQKLGLLTAGSWIPIVGEEEVRAMKPDYLFILPWHFLDEFRRRESAFLSRGGRFIVPLPELEII